MTTYRSSHARECWEQGWLAEPAGGGEPFARALSFEPRSAVYVRPARLERMQSFGSDKQRTLHLVPIPHEVDEAANIVTFPGRPQLAPVPYRTSRRIVVDVAESELCANDYYVRVRCDCGMTIHLALHNWRRLRTKQCRVCHSHDRGRKNGHDAWNAMPRGKKPEPVIVPFHKLTRER